MTNKKINVGQIEVAIQQRKCQDYISLTDMARFKNPKEPIFVLQNWLRTRNAVEFCGLWEKLNNPDFKLLDFEEFKKEAGGNSFVLTPKKWIESTNAVGIISKAGRYGGGTFAHKDIAFEFGTWLSPEFKLYLIREFQRLKEEESSRLNLDWTYQRHLAKVNYRIHTDAIKENLIPSELTRKQANCIYANEADLLNMALYGMTAREWREKFPDEKGNLRDHSTIEQLIVLSNLESLNAVLIDQKNPSSDRLLQLNRVAIVQMTSLLNGGGKSSLVVEEPQKEYGMAV